MISLTEIANYFPAHLKLNKQSMLREYLQCIILEIIYQGPFADKLCFLGGTCIRLVHNSGRFSEDLDFDHFGMTEINFTSVADHIRKSLELQGYMVEVGTVHRGAFRCNIRFPGLLFEQGLSGHKEEKILIQLDSQSQRFDFKPETILFTRFGVFTRLSITPPDVLLSQKLYTIVNRPRAKGRDYYDVVFLLSRGYKPNYAYLSTKMDIEHPNALREIIRKKLDQVDLDQLAIDLQPFLFVSTDDRRVRYFREFWEGVQL